MSRLPRNLGPNAWTRARAARGALPFDLTVTNPTVCGFPYPDDLLEPLRAPRSLVYCPDPKGAWAAREAVAEEYATHGVTVDPDRIVLCSSSSEAYGFLFKLLCDPGDTVLVPAPSYPLFEHLATLEGVRPQPYRLDPDHAWQPFPRGDEGVPASVAVLVHPNNPTGSFVEEAAAEGLVSSAGIPLIVDEVFLDYPLTAAAPRSYAGRDRGLTFALGGLSKSRGLPQLKLSWIVVSGPDREAAAAVERLDFIADTYLSVGTPVQEALPELLRRAAPVRDAILARCRENLSYASALAAQHPAVELLAPQGGWSVAFRYPNVVGEEELALELLERDGVAIHPGYFFDFEREGYFVASLIVPLDRFATGLRRAVDAIARRL